MSKYKYLSFFLLFIPLIVWAYPASTEKGVQFGSQGGTSTATSSNDFSSAVSRFTSPASNILQEVTIPGFGTPKAAIMYSVGSTPPGLRLATNGALFSFGVAYESAGVTNAWCFGFSSTNNVANTNTVRVATDTAMNNIITATPGNFGTPIFQEFITDGIKLRWEDAATARDYVIVFFGGVDLTAKSGTVTLGLEGETSVINTIGFEPDVVIFGSDGGPMDDNIINELVGSIGVAYNSATPDTGVTQFAFYIGEKDSDGLGEPCSTLSTNGVVGEVLNDARVWDAGITQYNASGFSIDVARNGDSGDVVGYLAMKIENHSIWTGVVNSFTSTGASVFSGIGFEPQMVMQLVGMHTGTNSLKTDSTAGVYGVSFLGEQSGTTTAECMAITIQDAATITATRRSMTNSGVSLSASDLSWAFLADLESMDADGWTMNYVIADGTERKWLGLAIEKD